MDDLDKAIRAAMMVVNRYARGGYADGGFFDKLFSGPDYMSNGKEASFANMPTQDETNADFFKADRAARMAQTKEEAPLTAPRPGPVEARDLPPPTIASPPPEPAVRRIETLPGDTVEPHDFPQDDARPPVQPADAQPPIQPAAYAPTPPQETVAKFTNRVLPEENVAPTSTILAGIRANESRNRPTAQNPKSSAGGLYQFLDSTWGSVLRRMDPETYGKYSNAQLKSLKTREDTTDLQHAAAQFYLDKDIAPRLDKAGIPLTPGSAYLSWFQGPAGAVKAYSAPENATVSQIFPKTVSANSNMRFNGKPYADWTMGDLRQWSEKKMSARMGRADGGLVDHDKAIRSALMTAQRFAGGGGAEYDPMGNVTVPAAGPEAEQAPVVMENAERVMKAEEAAKLKADIQAFEASKAQIQAQPEWARMMTHAPQEPRAPVQIEGGFIGTQKLGSAPYPVANALSGMAQGVYDFKTAPFYGLGTVFPPAAALGTAIDTAEGVAAGSPLQVAMGAFGTPMNTVRNVIAPLTVATGLTSSDPAEAARVPRVGGLSAALSKTAPQSAEMSLQQALEIAKSIPARELSPLGFYSHGAETAAGLQQAKGAPDQMAAMLQRYGVKPDEMYATGFANESATAAARSKIEAEFAPRVAEAQRAMEGLEPGTPEFKAAERQFKNISSTMRSEMDRALVLGDEWSARPSVTREEIAAHFKERMPQIEETVLGGRGKPEMDEAAKQKWIEDQAAERAYNSGDIERIRDWRDASNEVRDWHLDEATSYFNERMATSPDFASQFQTVGEGGATKFQQYSLPGGENYREVLLKMPEGYGAPKQALDDLAAARKRFKDLDKRHRDELEAGLTGDMNMSYEDFDKLTRERDIAAARVKNFEKLANQPAFQSGHWQDPNVLAHLRMADRTGPNGEKILHVEEIQSDWGQKGKKEGFVGKSGNLPEGWNVHEQKKRNGESEFYVINNNNTQVGIYAPTREEAIRSATQGKLGGIPTAPYVTNTQAWTDLALKRALREAAEGGYDKLIWTPGAEQAKRYDLSRHIDNITWSAEPDGKYWVGATGKDGRPVRGLENEPMTPKQLEETFGREVAEKIVKGEGKNIPGGPEMELSGLDLQTGGEGMKGYYDKIVPTQLSKLVKKLDPEAKVGMTDVMLPPKGGIGHNNPPLEAPGITITPKMREAILRGQTAHARGGAVGFARGGYATQGSVDEAAQYDPMGNVSVPAAGDDTGEPGLVDRAMEIVRQLNPVGSAEAASLPKILRPVIAERKLTLPEVRRTFDPQAGANMSPEDIDRLVNAYGRVATPSSLDPELARRGEEIAQSYITKGGSEYGAGRNFFATKPSVPLEQLGRVADPIPYSHELQPIVEKSWDQVGRERAGSPMITLGGDLSDWVRLRGYGPQNDLRGLGRAADIHAGFNYMREPNLNTVWANNPEHAAMLDKQVRAQQDILRAIKKDLPVMATAAPMGPRSIDSARNMMDLYLSAVEGSPIPKTHLEAAADDIRSGKFGNNPKEKATLKEKLADFPGFEDMDKAREFLLYNPEIAGTTRAAIIKGMEKEGYVKRGFPEVGQLRVAATDPKFMMAPGNVMGGRMVELDPRLFAVSERDKMFEHFTYPGNTAGKYYADVPLVHRQYGAPDAMDQLLAKYNQWRPGATKSAPPKAPMTVHPFSMEQTGRDTARKMFEEQRMVQPINQRMMESILRGEQRRDMYGFERGGAPSFGPDAAQRAVKIAKQQAGRR